MKAIEKFKPDFHYVLAMFAHF